MLAEPTLTNTTLPVPVMLNLFTIEAFLPIETSLFVEMLLVVILFVTCRFKLAKTLFATYKAVPLP